MSNRIVFGTRADVVFEDIIIYLVGSICVPIYVILIKGVVIDPVIITVITSTIGGVFTLLPLLAYMRAGDKQAYGFY